jgi:hypothetical protein
VQVVVDTKGRNKVPKGTVSVAFFDENILINKLVLDALDPISREPDFKSARPRWSRPEVDAKGRLLRLLDGTPRVRHPGGARRCRGRRRGPGLVHAAGPTGPCGGAAAPAGRAAAR